MADLLLLVVNLKPSFYDASRSVYRVRIPPHVKLLLEHFNRCTVSGCWLQLQDSENSPTLLITTDIAINAFLTDHGTTTGVLAQIGFKTDGSVKSVASYNVNMNYFNEEYITIQLCTSTGTVVGLDYLNNLKTNTLTLKFY